MYKPQARFALLSAFAILPIYATAGSCGMDVFYPSDKPTITIKPGEMVKVSTDVAVEPPEGLGIFLLSRSGQGTKRVCLANSVGLIDFDYRGALQLLIVNDGGRDDYVINPGDKIGQIAFLPIFQVEPVLVTADELTRTERGDGGFGSTGDSFNEERNVDLLQLAAEQQVTAVVGDVIYASAPAEAPAPEVVEGAGGADSQAPQEEQPEEQNDTSVEVVAEEKSGE